MLCSAHPLKPLFALLALLLCLPAVAVAVSLNGSWTYREMVGDSGDATREVRQNYSFGVGPALTYQPSHALSANVLIGYTQTNGVSEQGSRTGRTITPTAGLSLVNDLFSVQLSGNNASSQGDDGDWSNSINWNANLNSQWRELYVPRLFFSYGEVGAATGSDFAAPKTQSKDFGAGVDWDLYFADISYRYRQAKSESQPANQSHYAKLNTAGRFWDNRIAVSLSQQAQINILAMPEGALTDTTEQTVGGELRFATRTDDTPVASVCDEFLKNDCLQTVSYPIAYSASEYVQIMINPSVPTRIRAAEITFNADFDRGIGSVWDLYEEQPGNGGWLRIASDLPVVATSEELVDGILVTRQRITIPERDHTLLLVSNLRPSEGRITNVAFFSRVPSKSYQTNASLQMRISDTLSSSFGLTYNLEEDKDDRLTTSANLSWRPATFLSATLGASESRERKLDDEQQLNRNYSLTISTTPLPTVNVNFGVQWNERYGDELADASIDMQQKTLATVRYGISGKMQIYPDLSAGFNLSHNEGQRWSKERDAETDKLIDASGRFVASSGQSGRLDLNAKLYKNLTADLITQYDQSVSNEDPGPPGGVSSPGTVSKLGSAQLGLRLRLSELLLLRGSYRTVFIGTEAPDVLSLGLQARLLNTGKTRLDAQLSHTQAEQAVESISLNGSWLVSKKISLTGRSSYSFGESSYYNLTLDLRIGI